MKREYGAVIGEERNEEQSFHLQELIRLDRNTLLDLGCGAGYWSDRISKLNPWMNIIGIDVGEPFIEKAKKRYGSDRVQFQAEDFAKLSFDNDSFDCIYADNTLEHSFDVDETLAQCYRVLIIEVFSSQPYLVMREIQRGSVTIILGKHTPLK